MIFIIGIVIIVTLFIILGTIIFAIIKLLELMKELDRLNSDRG